MDKLIVKNIAGSYNRLIIQKKSVDAGLPLKISRCIMSDKRLQARFASPCCGTNYNSTSVINYLISLRADGDGFEKPGTADEGACGAVCGVHGVPDPAAVGG